MLAALGFVVLLHVHGLGLAVDALDVGLGLEVGFAHLQGHEPSGQGYDTDVVAGSGLYGYDVALFEGNFIAVAVVTFAGVLELHFYVLAFFGIAGNVGQPVVGVQLLVLSAAAFAAEVSASVM